MSEAPSPPAGAPSGDPAKTRPSGSLQLGRLFGIPIRIHWTFPLLLVWVAYSFWGEGLPVVLQMAGVVLIVFACVVLHELGHALAARRYGIRTRSITLLPIGGVAQLEGMPEHPGREVVVALAGPAVNVVIAVALFGVLLIAGVPNPFIELASADAAGGAGVTPVGPAALLWQVAMINVFLVIFNLIPAFPMDGGRVLRALLSLGGDRHTATMIAARVGQVIAVLFVAAGLFLPLSPFLILIGVFVFFGGMAEAQAVWFSEMVSGLRVGDAMMTEFDTLDADAPLRHAADRLLAGSQHEFPVVDGGRVVGLLGREGLRTALSRLADEAPIRAGMASIGPAFELKQPLAAACAALRNAGASAAPVEEGGRLVGLLTLENIEETIQLRSARQSRRERAGGGRA